MGKELKIEEARIATKSNDLIIRELLSCILQRLLAEEWFDNEQIVKVLEKIYNE